jgi:pimeloyl-ACP methyl ester carboxylesterase
VPLPGRGVGLAVTDWGGAGPVALCAHANGFCGALWAMVAAELAGDVRVVAVDLRGHGRSSAPPVGDDGHAYRWGVLADDVAALVEELGIEPALGVGNSVGGTSMLAAAARHPGLVGALLLVDPVILPRPRYAHPEQSPSRLMAGALKRRRRFPSRASVVAAYRERPVFAEWRPEALALYAEHGFVDTPDGHVELRCAPEVEAAVFRHAASLDPFALVPALRSPGVVLFARDSFAREPYEELVALAPALQLVDMDAPHLAPMTHPALVAGHVRAVLALTG